MQVKDLREYAKKHLLSHMLASGLSLDDVGSFIRRLPDDNPDRQHFADQYVEMLPQEDRLKVSISLLPNPNKLVKIIILTVVGQPAIFVPESITIKRVDELVEANYPARKGDLKHAWMRCDP